MPLLDTGTPGTSRKDTVRMLMGDSNPQSLDHKSSTLAFELNTSKANAGRSPVNSDGDL